MNRLKPLIFLFSVFITFSSGCKKVQDIFTAGNSATINLPTIKLNSFTSIIATRKNASVEITLNYFDAPFFYKERNYPVFPDYFEICLSAGDTNNWQMIGTVDTSYINNSFNIPGLSNGETYYVYLKEVYVDSMIKKNSNVVMFIPSSFKPYYQLILTDYYGHDLYSFDWSAMNDEFVYGTTFYEFKPGFSAASVFISQPGSLPRLVDISSWFPSLTSDGKRLTFSSDKNEMSVESFRPEHIMLFDINSGKSESLTSGNSSDRYPSWSPDNSLIAYSTSAVSDEELRIAVLDPGSHQKKVLQPISTPASNVLKYSEIHPTWSPDGRYIYYTYWTATTSNINPGMYDIYRISINGNNAEPFIHSSKTECSPVVSPDNTKLAFLTDLNGELQIWIYDMVYGKLHQPFDDSSYHFQPEWSKLKWKDNNIILFSNQKGLYSMTVE